MGDFNFPSIVWSDGHGLLNPNPTYVNSVFLETMNGVSLEVTEPTRQSNVLDIVPSNNNNIHNLKYFRESLIMMLFSFNFQ